MLVSQYSSTVSMNRVTIPKLTSVHPISPSSCNWKESFRSSSVVLSSVLLMVITMGNVLRTCIAENDTSSRIGASFTDDQCM